MYRPLLKYTVYRWHRWIFATGINNASQKWWENLPPVSTTPAAKLPPVSTTLVANLHRCQRHRWQIFPPFWLALLIPVANIHRCQWYWRQICHRCQRCRWQIATSGKQCRQLSNCWQLKWTWKNFFLYVNSFYPKVSKRNHKKFSDWRFFPFATGVVDTGGKPWAANISENFRKNLKRP